MVKGVGNKDIILMVGGFISLSIALFLLILGPFGDPDPPPVTTNIDAATILGMMLLLLGPIPLAFGAFDHFVWSKRDPVRKKAKIQAKLYRKIAQNYEKEGDLTNALLYYDKARELWKAYVMGGYFESVKEPTLEDIDGIGMEEIQKLKELAKEHALEIATIFELKEAIVQKWIDKARELWDAHFIGGYIRVEKVPMKEPTLEDIDGIGREEIQKLKELGINTPKELAKEHALEIATLFELEEAIVQRWIDKARELWKAYVIGD